MASMPKSSLAVLAKSRLSSFPDLIALFIDHAASELLNSGSLPPCPRANRDSDTAAASPAEAARKSRREERQFMAVVLGRGAVFGVQEQYIGAESMVRHGR